MATPPIDLAKIYNAFDAEEALSADDDVRYVDLSSVRGETNVSRKLVQRVKNAPSDNSHHLLMGHTKCGKTTELNRTARLLEREGYLTIRFDIAEMATRTFEYTTVLLIMAGQIIDQLTRRSIPVKEINAKKLAEFLVAREITIGGQLSGDVTGKLEAEFAPGFVAQLLGKLGLGLELRGGYQRSRDITVKVEADTRGFLEAIQAIVRDASDAVTKENYKGLVVLCDGCDKLEVSATDEQGRTRDLQLNMFVDHSSDLRSIPCHVIYTIPISIQANLGDTWEQTPEFVPAIPVNNLPDIDDRYPAAGRIALSEVVNQRLKQQGVALDQLFEEPTRLDELIAVSGGHISDLILLVRDAVLEAQADGSAIVRYQHIRRSIRSRAREYTRLIQSGYLETLVTIDQFKTTQSDSTAYRELIFKRLALEYSCGIDTRVDLHPLVAASDAYLRYKSPRSENSERPENS